MVVVSDQQLINTLLTAEAGGTTPNREGNNKDPATPSGSAKHKLNSSNSNSVSKVARIIKKARHR